MKYFKLQAYCKLQLYIIAVRTEHLVGLHSSLPAPLIRVKPWEESISSSSLRAHISLHAPLIRVKHRGCQGTLFYCTSIERSTIAPLEVILGLLPLI
jgi:hypothetical protein